MRILILFIGIIAFSACQKDQDPFAYSESFLRLIYKCETDFGYLDKQIDSMGSQIKLKGRIDSALFKSTLATTARLTEELEIVIDSLVNTGPYKGDDRIKKRTINLLSIYHGEILPTYTLYITAHYNVYGKNWILKMNKLEQDSLNEIIITTSERFLDVLDRQLKENEETKYFIKNWAQAFKSRPKTHAMVAWCLYPGINYYFSRDLTPRLLKSKT